LQRPARPARTRIQCPATQSSAMGKLIFGTVIGFILFPILLIWLLISLF
jgi:hypothetical protein